MATRGSAVRFSPSSFVALRSPLLPFDDLIRWGEDLEAPATPADAEALGRDRALLRARLRELVARPEVREAIFVASPAVDALIDGWVDEPESERSRDCERALVRYVSRMAGRATPFGLFAGMSTVTLADTTNLALEPRDCFRRTTRLDAGYLVDVLGGLLEDADYREGLTYRPNPSLYRCGDRWRYVHSRPAAHDERHRLISVRDSDALTTALDATVPGATPTEIRAALSSDNRVPERVAAYVDDLIAQQVLVPDVRVQVTGADATYGLADVVPRLAEVRSELAALDDAALGHPTSRYLTIAESLEELPAEPKIERLFQVDMTKPTSSGTIGSNVVAEILRGVELLHRLGHRDSRATKLEAFVERFTARYEGQPVPLLEALDPDLGVGFGDEEAAPSPLLADIGGRDSRPRPSEWGPREDQLLTLLSTAQAAGAAEVVLTARDIEKLEQRDPEPLPDAFAAIAILAGTSRAAIDDGRFRVLVLGSDGPSGARLLGRFCHGDERLAGEVEVHLRAEEALDEDAVFAEIVHLPSARDANVIARPVLRGYEIECLDGSGAAPELRIPVGDLLVSVRDGRVVLHSRRLELRIVPRLTSAHNFAHRGMSSYRFLCALQLQGVGNAVDFWGPVGSAPFLPRVRSGRVVLACAAWRLDAESLGVDGDFAAVQAWRQRWSVPRFVAAMDFGGQYPVDLDNVLSVTSLVQSVRSTGSARLIEFFPPLEEMCVEGPEGVFAHELVVPFVRAAPVRGAPSRIVSDATVRRRFPPGSEWLYARLYIGETVADDVLVRRLAPLVHESLGSGLVDRWFFLRYADPEFHLRLRLRGDPQTLRDRVLPSIEDVGRRLLDDGLAWRMELGTYQREAERYGGPAAVEHAEAAFHADSEAVVSILPLLAAGEAGRRERWQLGLAGVHRLLLDLGLEDDERLALMRGQRDGLVRELGWDGAARGRVGAKFRQERRPLEELLAAEPGDGHPLDPGLALLRARSERLAPVARELERLDDAGRLTLTRPAIAASLAHMHLNRLLHGNNAAQELVICDFLARLYQGAAQRKR